MGSDSTLYPPRSNDAGVSRRYMHVETNPSSLWEVAHFLGAKPVPVVVDSADTVVTGDVRYIDDNHLEIEFRTPFAGRAYMVA
jgi:hypothetical protein